MQFNLPICVIHKATSVLDDFMTEDGKWEIGMRFKDMNQPPPVWSTAKLDWARVRE